MDELAAGPLSERHIFTVSEVTSGLRELLEDRVGRIWLVGEISNLRQDQEIVPTEAL